MKFEIHKPYHNPMPEEYLQVLNKYGYKDKQIECFEKQNKKHYLGEIEVLSVKDLANLSKELKQGLVLFTGGANTIVIYDDRLE